MNSSFITLPVYDLKVKKWRISFNFINFTYQNKLFISAFLYHLQLYLFLSGFESCKVILILRWSTILFRVWCWASRTGNKTKDVMKGLSLNFQSEFQIVILGALILLTEISILILFHQLMKFLLNSVHFKKKCGQYSNVILWILWITILNFITPFINFNTIFKWGIFTLIQNYNCLF